MLRLLDALERSRVTTIGGNMTPPRNSEAESPRGASLGQRDIRVQPGKPRKRDREQSQWWEDDPGERIYRRKQQALNETCQFARDCGLDFFNPIDCTSNDLPKDLLAKLSMNDTVNKGRPTCFQPGKPSGKNQEQNRGGGAKSPDDIRPHRPREEDTSGGWKDDRLNENLKPPSYHQPSQMKDIRRDNEEAEDFVRRLRSGLAERRRQGTLPIPQNSIKRIQGGEDLKEIQAMRRLETHLIENTLHTIT